MPSLDISPDARKIIDAIRAQYLPENSKLAVYGSRARGDAQTFSDLDLVIVGGELSFPQLATVKEAFVESDLPYRVDITTWGRLSTEFQHLIEPDMVFI